MSMIWRYTIPMRQYLPGNWYVSNQATFPLRLVHLKLWDVADDAVVRAIDLSGSELGRRPCYPDARWPMPASRFAGLCGVDSTERWNPGERLVVSTRGKIGRAVAFAGKWGLP